MNLESVLVMCVGNSCRSQMAGAWLRHLSGGRLRVATAGTKPSAALQPMAIAVMKEVGIDLEAMGEHPKSVKEFLGKETFGVALFVCSEQEAECPSIYPFALGREGHPFADPGHFPGTPEQKMEQHRIVRDAMKAHFTEWLNTHNMLTMES